MMLDILYIFYFILYCLFSFVSWLWLNIDFDVSFGTLYILSIFFLFLCGNTIKEYNKMVQFGYITAAA